MNSHFQICDPAHLPAPHSYKTQYTVILFLDLQNGANDQDLQDCKCDQDQSGDSNNLQSFIYLFLYIFCGTYLICADGIITHILQLPKHLIGFAVICNIHTCLCGSDIVIIPQLLVNLRADLDKISSLLTEIFGIFNIYRDTIGFWGCFLRICFQTGCFHILIDLILLRTGRIVTGFFLFYMKNSLLPRKCHFQITRNKSITGGWYDIVLRNTHLIVFEIIGNNDIHRFHGPIIFLISHVPAKLSPHHELIHTVCQHLAKLRMKIHLSCIIL